VFTPDGKGILTAGWDGSARLWDAQTGEERARFRGLGGLDGGLIHAGGHFMLVWAMHGRTMAWFDLDLRPPDAATQRRIDALIGQLDEDDYRTRESASAKLKALGWVTAAALAKAAKESKSAEVRIRARAVLTALRTEPRKTLKGHTGNLRAVCISKDGALLASGSEDGTVRLWDRTAGRQQSILER
jgi:WD40 repeat protein